MSNIDGVIKKARVQTPTDSYVEKYPAFVEAAELQLNKAFWRQAEIIVEKDIQDMRVHLTEAERWAVVTNLSAFLRYELFIGNEYWGGRVAKAFPRPEVERMASVFACMELAVHAPFYDKINKALNLADDEFYSEYKTNRSFKGRLKYINKIVDEPDDLRSLAGFVFLEGSVLYSSFALFKHFQANGKNKITNVVRGINQSAIDENIHATAGAALFRTAMEEGEYTQQYLDDMQECVIKMAHEVVEHETAILLQTFERGEIDGYSFSDGLNFVKHRADLCLSYLGYEPIFNPEENPVAEWFYPAVTRYISNDFFTGMGREYNSDWDMAAFSEAFYKPEENIYA